MDNYQEKENEKKDRDHKQKVKYNKMKKNELLEELSSREKDLKKAEKSLQEMTRELEEIRKNEKQYREQIIRMQADFENYKKREDKKKQEFMKYAKQDLICQLLSIIDNLERAASYTQNKEYQPETIEEGIKGTLKEFRKILEKEGLKHIKALGEKFDPYCHEAIMQVESDQYPEDTVMEEISKGYYLNSKVIRPSLVKVSKGHEEKASGGQKEEPEISRDEEQNNKNNEI